MSATIEGMADLLRQLDGLDKQLVGEALDEGLLAAAEVVKGDALQRVPVRTGKLRDSIYAASHKTVPAGLRRTKAKLGTAKVAAGMYHAHLVEYGTRRSRAQPFLRPALDNQQGEALRAFESALKAKTGL